MCVSRGGTSVLVICVGPLKEKPIHGRVHSRSYEYRFKHQPGSAIHPPAHTRYMRRTRVAHQLTPRPMRIHSPDSSNCRLFVPAHGCGFTSAAERQPPAKFHSRPALEQATILKLPRKFQRQFTTTSGGPDPFGSRRLAFWAIMAH